MKEKEYNGIIIDESFDYGIFIEKDNELDIEEFLKKFKTIEKMNKTELLKEIKLLAEILNLLETIENYKHSDYINGMISDNLLEIKQNEYELSNTDTA